MFFRFNTSLPGLYTSFTVLYFIYNFIFLVTISIITTIVILFYAESVTLKITLK